MELPIYNSIRDKYGACSSWAIWTKRDENRDYALAAAQLWTQQLERTADSSVRSRDIWFLKAHEGWER